MILTRSPYYKNVPWIRPSDSATADKFTLQLFVWSGDKITNKPVTPTYEITKENVEVSTGISKVDVARLIDDFIVSENLTAVTTSVINGKNAVWSSTQIVYDVAGDLTTELIETDIAFKGYGYGNDIENYQPTSDVLLDGTDYDIDQSTIFILPILIDETAKADDLIVTSYPDENIKLIEDLGTTTESSESIKLVYIVASEALSDTTIEITIGGSVLIELYIKSECIYTPKLVTFINRYGALQGLTFFTKSIESIRTSSEQYESNGIRPNLGGHQFKEFNKNGRTDVILNTGYLDETYNEAIRQLMLSERVWIDGTPANITTQELTYKTRVNDKLVDYQIGFSYSYNEISTF
jgi:hypothetical protein